MTGPQGESWALVRVLGNGVGIDEKLLNGGRIFDLFTQPTARWTALRGGLGIGLSMVHRLVALHSGSVEARSDGPGKGSQFFVRLPMVSAPLVTEVKPPEAPHQPEGANGPRVLVVDDDIDLVTMLTNWLRHKGYAVRSADTGPDGLKIALQWRPDLVLLDIGLPGLDGYEVARRLRAGAKTSEARLIALTGYGRDTDVALAREAGFDAHLVKLGVEDPEVKIIVYSAYDDQLFQDRVMVAGAGGLLSKSDSPAEGPRAIRQVAAGMVHFPSLLSPDRDSAARTARV
jgi:CheY-like chemotaxis protein